MYVGFIKLMALELYVMQLIRKFPITDIEISMI